jgi:hypothetical protein
MGDELLHPDDRPDPAARFRADEVVAARRVARRAGPTARRHRCSPNVGIRNAARHIRSRGYYQLDDTGRECGCLSFAAARDPL